MLSRVLRNAAAGSPASAACSSSEMYSVVISPYWPGRGSFWVSLKITGPPRSACLRNRNRVPSR